jgi:hypothetical protein
MYVIDSGVPFRSLLKIVHRTTSKVAFEKAACGCEIVTPVCVQRTTETVWAAFQYVEVIGLPGPPIGGLLITSLGHAASTTAGETNADAVNTARVRTTTDTAK